MAASVANLGFDVALKGSVVTSRRSDFFGSCSSVCNGTSSTIPPSHSRTYSVVCPVSMSRVCDMTGKKANNGYKVSFSASKTKTLQQVNLQVKRLWWEEGKRFVKLKLSTKALKTIERDGLDVVARKNGIDLRDF
eukprot:TRINITY_DN22190_c0_g1_i1.p1 TRINITY_DN22190_c0_g1~~TRINITY_DN22190_c0_g1_i1.p1  ORF type:complete len:148 (-),score=29.25 TRINITY_DN22190_c0_g1_i1:534-938(-)